MDEILNNRHKEIFLRLLTNPADTGGVYLLNLQELVKAYPQSGLFRAMYGRALNESTPIVAGGYFDNRALHKLLYHNDSLLPVSQDQLILQGNSKQNGNAVITESAQTSAIPAAVNEDIAAVTETSDLHTDTPANFPDVLDVQGHESQIHQPEYTNPLTEELAEETYSEPAPEETFLNEEPVAEIPEPGFADEEPLGRAPWEIEEETEEETTPPILAEAEPVYTHFTQETIKEEIPEPVIVDTQSPVYQPPVVPPAVERTPWEQIAEEYAALTAQSNARATPQTPAQAVPDTPGPVADETHVEATAEPQFVGQKALDEVDQLIYGNAAGTKYFALDNSFVEHKNGSPDTTATTEQGGLQVNQPAHEKNGAHQDVSKYHDEKMPYSFMWWLDKTRKEHDATYQPYAFNPGNGQHGKPGKKDDLQQQYFENIFHMSSVDTLVNAAESKTIAFDMQNKEDRIIKRFITEDPHIHPPLGEKLDTENKAKRSSEDEYDMVTETLARIYADQMLFPKAIATYRKLMLKFPEKSRYFASRIDALEKRTN